MDQKIDQKKLRRYEHSLVISGAGIIVFAAWNIIKAVLYFVLTPLEEVANSLTDEQIQMYALTEYSKETLAYILIAVILLLLVLSLALRYYIGRAAIQEGRRIRKRSPLYIVLAIILCSFLIDGTIINGFVLSADDKVAMGLYENARASIFVDITSILCLIEMIVSAIMVRRLRKGAA